MKRKVVIITILTLAAVLLCACGIEKNSNNTVENNTTQKPSSSEISSQNPPEKVTEKPSTVEQSLQPSPMKLTEISTKELKQFLASKRSEILKEIGNQTENGTVSVMESHMVFPFTFAKDLGLTFVFPNETDDFSPTYIVINKGTNLKDVNVKGAKPGMDFKEIMGKMGNSKVVKTWFSNEDNVAYKLDYVIDGVVYSFVSYDEQGKESQLYIALKEN